MVISLRFEEDLNVKLACIAQICGYGRQLLDQVEASVYPRSNTPPEKTRLG